MKSPKFPRVVFAVSSAAKPRVPIADFGLLEREP